MIRQLLMSSWFRHSLDKYRWYRKWYGGRWEFWRIDILPCPVWLHKDPSCCWPEHKQCCGVGEPVVEDWGALVGAVPPMLKAIQRDYKELMKEHPDEPARVEKDQPDHFENK